MNANAPSSTGDSEFEAYLARRNAVRRATAVGLAVLFVSLVAGPYALMRAGKMTHDTFEIFAFLGGLVGLVFVRTVLRIVLSGGRVETGF